MLTYDIFLFPETKTVNNSSTARATFLLLLLASVAGGLCQNSYREASRRFLVSSDRGPAGRRRHNTQRFPTVRRCSTIASRPSCNDLVDAEVVAIPRCTGSG